MTFSNLRPVPLDSTNDRQHRTQIASTVNALQRYVDAVPAQYGTPVTAFGTKGDGVTDDTNAIQGAVAAAGVGGVVVVPPGTYIVSGINLNLANQTFILCAGATLKAKAATSTNILSVNAAGVKIRGDGTCDGNAANVTASTCVLISAQSNVTVDGPTLTNTKFSGTYGYGLHAQDAPNLLTKNLTITNTGYIGYFAEITAGADIPGLRAFNIVVDRSAQGAGITEGMFKVHGQTHSHYFLNPVIVGINSTGPTSPTDTSSICAEIWDCKNAVIDAITTGGGYMGVSLGNVQDSALGVISPFNASQYGVEFAGSVRNTGGIITVRGNGLTVNGAILDPANSINPTDNALGIISVNGCTGSAFKAIGANGLSIAALKVKMATAAYAAEIVSTQDFALHAVLDGANIGTKAITLDTSWNCEITVNAHDFTQNGVLSLAASAVTLDNITVKGVLRNCNVPFGQQYSGGAVGGNNIRIVGVPGMPDYLDFTNVVLEMSGTGTPLGVVTAGVGSIFHRRDGGASTTLYVKESGSGGSTGWVAK